MQDENEIHHLSEYFNEESGRSLTPVGPGKRFINFMVDRIFIAIIIYGLNIIIKQADLVFQASTDFEAQMINILYELVMYLVLMFMMEALMKGKTIGKIITKTRAVNEQDGSFISTKTALLRSLCRIVPFDPLSAFGTPSYPWHDTWTKTTVVDD